MNAATETAEITTETTAFQRSVLRAMLELAGSNTSNEIAKQAGVKSEPVRVCLARLRDAGLIGTEVNPDRGGPPLWHLRASVDTVRSMVAAPIPSANDGTPGDDEPAPEPGDTQAVDAAEAAPDPGGWIPWRGGECPVPEGVACWVRFRDGLADICHTPERLFWGRGIDEDNEDDIVDYRPEPKQTGPASFDDPDDYGDDEIPPAAAYDATVEAEAAADEAPLIGEDVNSDADVLGGWCADHEMAISPRPVRGDDVAMIVSADGSVSADMPALRFAPPATGGAVASGPCPTVALLIQRASPVAAEAMRRAVAAAEAEALLREKEANIALDMARDARVRGRAVAEIIRFAEQRAGLAGDADPDAVLIAIVELLDGARSAVTGMSRPA